MKETVAEMWKSEFREWIETIIEQKLLDVLGDPDEGRELREAVRARLDKQRAAGNPTR